jgi:diguanylate cyclase (GGDEF)-like protein
VTATDSTAASTLPLPAPRVWPLEVVVVDDDADSCRVLANVLRTMGHSCREAVSASEALSLLAAQRADVVLCDWEMPGMTGVELCQRTRRDDGESHYTYFILVTGQMDRHHILTAMEAGADDYQRKPLALDDLEAHLVLASRVVGLHRRLAEQTARLRRDSERFYNASHTDALTGVGSRLALEEELLALRARQERYGRPACLALCDVDLFKQYNDRNGHVAGDAALRQIAQALKGRLRASDRVYRFGGEEFVILFPEQHLDDALGAIERLRQEVEDLRIAAPTPSGVLTISAGLAELGLADTSTTESVARADVALYRAKQCGRNRVESQPPPRVRSPRPEAPCVRL